MTSNQHTFRIATNFTQMSRACSSRFSIEQHDLREYRSWSALAGLLTGRPKVDLIVVNIDSTMLFRLCILRWLIRGLTTTPKLVSVDILLSRPRGLGHSVAAWLKRILLHQVDLFILYFHDLTGYERYYGIGRDRTAYVPFKSNSWDEISPSQTLDSDGEYVLTAGRTKRDLTTFVRAMSMTGLPAVLLCQRQEVLSKHGTPFPNEALPPNVRLIEHDGQRESWVEHIRHARVVVVPILETTISSSGIGTYLDSMALKKAVVITDGPATRGILDDQALVVPPTDADALATAVVRLWNDQLLREQIASRGRRYAEKVQGEERLLRDIMYTCLHRCLSNRHVPR